MTKGTLYVPLFILSVTTTPRLDSQTSQVHVDAVAEVVRHVLGYRLQRRVSRSCHESRRRLEGDIAHA